LKPSPSFVAAKNKAIKKYKQYKKHHLNLHELYVNVCYITVMIFMFSRITFTIILHANQTYLKHVYKSLVLNVENNFIKKIYILEHLIFQNNPHIE